MHVRPIVLVAIFAAAAGASVTRLATGGGSRPFAVGASTPEPISARADRVSTIRAATTMRGTSGGQSSPGFEASADGGVTLRPGARAVVYVAGNVRRPGVYALADGARVGDALRAAGGPTAAADPVAVDLAARVEDGEEIAVPARGLADAASVPEPGDAVSAPSERHARHRRRRKHAHRRPRPAVAAAADDARASEIVDVNVADAATLATLPGIGPGLAERIVAFRDLNGPFASADELLDVGGVTASKVERLASSVTFDVPGAAHVAR